MGRKKKMTPEEKLREYRRQYSKNHRDIMNAWRTQDKAKKAKAHVDQIAELGADLVELMRELAETREGRYSAIRKETDAEKLQTLFINGIVEFYATSNGMTMVKFTSAWMQGVVAKERLLRGETNDAE